MDFRKPSKLSDFTLMCTDGTLYTSKMVAARIGVFAAAMRFEQASFRIDAPMAAGELLLFWAIGATSPHTQVRKKFRFNALPFKEVWEILNLAHDLCEFELQNEVDRQACSVVRRTDINAEIVNTAYAKNFEHLKARIGPMVAEMDLRGVCKEAVRGQNRPTIIRYIKANKPDVATVAFIANNRESALELAEAAGFDEEQTADLFLALS